MGLLAESKSRKSIGKDPNNTKWTRDTTTFGQKILRSQGWEPGQYLGAKDAPHSELHTAANASYIRVALKDDMKGLGYSKSKEDEVTGLDVFSDLLSRLNGKSQAQVEQEQAARLEFKTNRYVEQKWGPMRFLSGGLLVGDAMKSDAAESADDGSAEKRLKRKADSQSNATSSESEDDHKRQKREKKRRKKEKKAEKELRKSASAEDGSLREKEDKRRKREKKAQRESRAETEADSTPGEETAEPDESGAGDEKSKQSRRDKKEKREKKDGKSKDKKSKDRKREKGESKSRGSEGSDSGPSSSGAASGKSTPVPSGTSTPVFGRNFVRSRFIAQKQRVLMDTEALKQILMIKT